jgi:hypothetical protein
VVHGAPEAELLPLLRDHPAWPALAFVAGPDELVSLPHAAELLAHVVDPRWYRHPFRPHRFTRLYAHLGLSPANMRARLGVGSPGRHHARALAAVNAWYSPAGLAAYGGLRCGRPECFLWRVYASQSRSIARGLLRATTRFVDFVSLVWLEAECRTAGFEPGRFFRADELAAFEACLAGLQPGKQ